ncbi:hypothetical protein FLB_11260 [Flavobacterium succinicans]|uniref:Uncharacterized protein n=1 Tax=Flavobacterium succinicans TaxID=29536 RepID=A0A199XQV4_9FLAO|nr:hypothetical protein FLB_11260 [Flavobacterium succinicans]
MVAQKYTALSVKPDPPETSLSPNIVNLYRTEQFEKTVSVAAPTDKKLLSILTVLVLEIVLQPPLKVVVITSPFLSCGPETATGSYLNRAEPET